jgi:mono/diheme cytochrome c family protein
MKFQASNCKQHRVTGALRIALLIVLAAVLAGCQSEPDAPITLEPGQGEFLRWCGSCHGNSGEGKAPAFPPLAGSEWLEFPDRGLAMIILYGLRGEIEVAGRTYRGYMPPMTHLPDEDIEAILAYVTRTWAGRQSTLSVSDIAALREAEDTRPLNGREGLESRLEAAP